MGQIVIRPLRTVKYQNAEILWQLLEVRRHNGTKVLTKFIHTHTAYEPEKFDKLLHQHFACTFCGVCVCVYVCICDSRAGLLGKSNKTAIRFETRLHIGEYFLLKEKVQLAQ